MVTSIIASDVTLTVNLGSAAYTSQITVTSLGTIAPVAAGADGVYGSAANDGVSNYGTILGSNSGAGAGGTGVQLNGGMVFNDGLILGGSRLGGSYGFGGDGIVLAGGLVANSGTILGGNNAGTGVYLADGTLVNAGVIAGGAGESTSIGGAGVDLAAMSTLTNTGTILGGVGTGGRYPVDGGDAVSIQSGIATNFGVIIGGAGGAGNYSYGGEGVFQTGGIFINTASVTGGYAGGFGLAIGAGTFVNAGRLSGGSGVGYGIGGFGAGLFGGVVINNGVISGGEGGLSGGPRGMGVYLDGGTLINAGTVSAGAGLAGAYALSAGIYAAATLVIDPQAVFNGLVIGDFINDTLVLASAASIGTIGGIGSMFAGFNTLDEAAGADWLLVGANTITAGTDLAIGGTLSIGGSLVLAGGTLSGAGTVGGPNGIVDDGRIIAAGGTLTLQELAAGTGLARIEPGATLVAAAGLGVARIRFAAGGNEDLVVPSAAMVSGTLTGFGPGDVIDLQDQKVKSVRFAAGTLTLTGFANTIIGSLDVSGIYRTANFALKSDGNGGTDIDFRIAAAITSGLQDVVAASVVGSVPTGAQPAPAGGLVGDALGRLAALGQIILPDR